MGKGVEQESESTPVSHQMQIVGSMVNFSGVTFASSLSHVKRDHRGLLIVPGREKAPTYSTNFFSASLRGGMSYGSFPDSSPPVTLCNDIMAFSDTDESFFRLVSVDRSAVVSFVNIKKAKCSLRECPGGQQGGASGGGSYSSNGSSGATQAGGSWVFGGGIGGPLGGTGGSGDDDDPSKRPPNSNNSGPSSAPYPYIEEEEFNSYNYLDDAMIEDILRDMPFDDIVLSHPQFGFNRDPGNSFPTDSSDPPSTPAPLTPGPMTPMYAPTTPHFVPHPSMVSSPPQGVQQVDKSDTRDLLEIQRLMINGPSERSSSSTIDNTSYVVPLPSLSSYSAQNMLYNNRSVPQRLPPKSVPAVMPAPPSDIDFLATTIRCDHTHRIIELFVPSEAPQGKKEIGFRALQHNYSVYLQYQDTVKNASLTELQVANQQTANLCSLGMGMENQPKLCFKMPNTCVPLAKWVEDESQTIVKRQLVLQQLVNTLTILFKAQNNLCFWGSSQVWIDQDLRVYLYIDFIKALAIQKKYAENCVQVNPRVEDCKVLVEVYNMTLKPFLQSGLTWISPQLGVIFSTFEELLKDPSRCVSNMAYVARVLGERRICKLQVGLMIGAPLQYTIYCAEHETISASLNVLAGVLPLTVARWWVVLRSRDNSPVGVTEIAAKEVEGFYNIAPLPDNTNVLPGALYIESQQPW